jgi:hypothetical protein
MEFREKVTEKVVVLGHLPMLSRPKKTLNLKPVGPSVFTQSTSKRTSTKTMRKVLTSVDSTPLDHHQQLLTPVTSQTSLNKSSGTSYLQSFKNLSKKGSSCKRFRNFPEVPQSKGINLERPLLHPGWFSKSQTGSQQGVSKKHNQDSHIILPHFSSLNLQIFAVFDGHGPNGHQVSSFLSSNLSKHLESSLQTHSQIKDLKTFLKNSLKSALNSLSQSLLKFKSIDSVFSGSTGVVVIIHSDFCICANVGDSRAVIGNFLNGSWVVYPLSKDHKPGDIEEKMRIESLGGLVEPLRGKV